MKVGCPICGGQYDLEAALNDKDSKLFCELVAGMPPPLAKALIRYLGLWRPLKRGIRWPRMLKEARVLAPMIEAERITFKKNPYKVPTAMWVEVMNDIADRPDSLDLPLTHHNYLLKILANKAEKIEAKAEAKREEQKRRPKRKSSGMPKHVTEMFGNKPTAEDGDGE